MANILRKRGDTYAMEFIIKNKNTGDPMNLSGASLIMTADPVRTPSTSANNIFSLAGIITDPINGRVEFRPTAAEMNHVGNFFYDIQMLDSAGKIRTLVLAQFDLLQDITK